MPTDLIARIDLDLLYLPFAEKYLDVLARCRKRGVDYYAISGYRSPEEQQALWQKGRNPDGAVVRHAQVVTNVRFSAHCAGAAADAVLDGSPTPGLQPNWNDVQKYVVLAEEAEALGLEAGFRWKSFQDPGHVQLPLNAHRVSLTRLRTEYEAGGVGAVHAFLDAHGPW